MMGKKRRDVQVLFGELADTILWWSLFPPLLPYFALDLLFREPISNNRYVTGNSFENYL